MITKGAYVEYRTVINFLTIYFMQNFMSQDPIKGNYDRNSGYLRN